ncbi:MAG: plasmid stabilization system [Bacteroidetes bacterium OLB12]|nr:MAG: plasmid stabilization system [Bacteroidetes bacterium OLB12]HNR74297.1 type II toxin-antitoxin system RelE/ParE family toxin [Cyclobacteriaceae bacterium]HNU42714.1 type II toxin-antitoxin system RelE/ParE family toxin [Cyclobacteriaceae bacterium]
MTVKVSKRAEKSFHSIKDFIKLKWGELVANAFEERVIDFLDLLENFPEIGTLEKIGDKRIYGFQLTKQTKVFYRIKGERIIIIVFLTLDKTQRKNLDEVRPSRHSAFAIPNPDKMDF